VKELRWKVKEPYERKNFVRVSVGNTSNSYDLRRLSPRARRLWEEAMKAIEEERTKQKEPAV
jgi:predicted metal-dependent hydrolase